MSNLLVVDMGNQRLKWAILSVVPGLSVDKIFSEIEKRNGALSIVEPGALKQGARPADQLVESVGVPERIVFSCVSARQAGEAFVTLSRESWGIEPQKILAEDSRYGLENQYDLPQQLGADRWLAALAAYHMMQGSDRGDHAIIVIDAGTAVTVDLVVDNQFRGGSILPGVAMLVRALGISTGEIRIDIESLTKRSNNLGELDVVATNSDAAVWAGSLASVTGGIERCLDMMQRTSESPIKVLVTGGDADLVASMISYRCEVIPNLVLAGLALTASESM
ncbi:MAG: type III pantothenate kinase [bacterium]